MVEIQKQKVGAGLNVQDITILMSSKVVTERAYSLLKNNVPAQYTNFIPHNRTYLSGVIKVLGGFVVAKNSNSKMVKLVGVGALLDGVEDILDNVANYTGVQERTQNKEVSNIQLV